MEWFIEGRKVFKYLHKQISKQTNKDARSSIGISQKLDIDNNRSSHPEVFLGKGVLKICSKFTGEHPCQSAISIVNLYCNCKFAAYFQSIFF